LFSKINKTGINFSNYENIPVKCEGEKAPSPVTTVEEAGLCRLVMDNVSKVGYTSLTPVQRYSIPIVMGGRDLMACAQTGSGKTAAFLLPIIHNLISTYQPRSEREQGCHKPKCLIVTPTRELAIQIYNEVKKFAYSSPLKSALAYGGVSTGSQLASYSHGCDILVATPGRLIDFVGQGKVGFHLVKYLVLDEADRMLDMGFMPDVKRIVGDPNMPPKGERVTLMFSATFPAVIRKVADQFLHQYLFLTVGVVGGACKDVLQKFYQVAKRDKKDRLSSMLAELGVSKTLVFIRTKHKTHRLAQQLYREGFACNSIHGDRSQGQRELALAQFRDGVSTVLLATAVVARGLDIPEVANVINYDMPGEIDEYVHRIGRTGRVGNNGQAFSFWDMDEDTKIQKDLVRILTESGQIVPDWLQLNIETKSAGGQRKGKGGGGKEGKVRDKENVMVENQEVNNRSKKKENVKNNVPKTENKMNSRDVISKSPKSVKIEVKDIEDVKVNGNNEKKGDGNVSPSDSQKKKRVRNRGKGSVSRKEGEGEEKIDANVEDVNNSDKVKKKRNRNRGKKDKSEHVVNDGSDNQGGDGAAQGEGGGGGNGWAASRQASLPEMARDRPGPALARRTASQYEFERGVESAGSGRQQQPGRDGRAGQGRQQHGRMEDQGRPQHGRDGQNRGPSRPHDGRDGQSRGPSRASDGRDGQNRGPARPQPSAPVADIIGILQQQARGGKQEQGEVVERGNRETSSYRPHPVERQEFRGSSGGRGGGGGGGGGPPAQVNSEVADLASLLELKARLAQEKVGTGRREGGRRRQEVARDLANTSHWPAL